MGSRQQVWLWASYLEETMVFIHLDSYFAVWFVLKAPIKSFL